MNFKKLLIAINYSSMTPTIIEYGLNLAKKEAARVMIFHCLDIDTIISNLSIIDLNKDEIEEWLKNYQQQFIAEKILAEFNYKLGLPGEEICNLALTWRADLIIVGRRGLKGITELLLRSTSNYVFHHAPCPVLVIQGEALQAIK